MTTAGSSKDFLNEQGFQLYLQSFPENVLRTFFNFKLV